MHWSSSRQDQLTARDTAKNAEDALLLLIAEAPGTPLELTTEPADPVAMSLDLSAIEQAALANNAELTAAA